MLTFLASIIGTVIGLSIAIYLQVYGIDISGEGNLAIGGIVFDPIWRASVSLTSVFLPVVLMMLTSIVASIYPASIAARIKPVEAIHYKP